MTITPTVRHDSWPGFWQQTVPYPTLKRRSITEHLPIGLSPVTRTAASAVFRQENTYLWGQHGSGRSIALANLVAGHLQCTDALVWSIGLAAAMPFLRPFGDGRVTTPSIDWVAPTLDEAVAMARSALAFALHRQRVYTELKYQHNTNLMPVGDGAGDNPPPAIVIIVGPDAPDRRARNTKPLYDLLDMVGRHGRDSAVRVVYSGLRATADYMPTPTPGIRIAMRPTDPDYLAHTFGDWKLEPIAYAGAGYVRADDFSDVEPFKAYYLDPVRMDEIGEQTAPWRPVLDRPTWSSNVESYPLRWRRTAEQLWVKPLASTMAYNGCH